MFPYQPRIIRDTGQFTCEFNPPPILYLLSVIRVAELTESELHKRKFCNLWLETMEDNGMKKLLAMMAVVVLMTASGVAQTTAGPGSGSYFLTFALCVNLGRMNSWTKLATMRSAVSIAKF